MSPDKKNESSQAPRSALGPSAAPDSFKFIFLSGFMKPPKLSIFPAKNIFKTTEIIKKSMKFRPQNKKNMRGFHWNPALVIFRLRIQLYSLYITYIQLYKHIHIFISTWISILIIFPKTISILIQTNILICIAKNISNLCFTNNGDLKEDEFHLEVFGFQN